MRHGHPNYKKEFVSTSSVIFLIKGNAYLVLSPGVSIGQKPNSYDFMQKRHTLALWLIKIQDEFTVSKKQPKNENAGFDIATLKP